jgi:hypothetical protein
MNSFELLLLLLFIVIVYLVVVQRAPTEIVIGGAALWFVMLWIGGDNMGAWDKMNILEHVGIHKKSCGSCSTKNNLSNLANQANPVNSPGPKATVNPNAHYDADAAFPDQAMFSNDDTGVKDSDSADIDVAPQLLPESSRPKPLEYSENNYLKNIFDEIGSLGDNEIAHRMKYMSNMNRVAMDNQARQDKYTNLNYLKQELDDHANSVWWDDDVALEQKF